VNISLQSWFRTNSNWNYCCSRYPANMAAATLQTWQPLPCKYHHYLPSYTSV